MLHQSVSAAKTNRRKVFQHASWVPESIEVFRRHDFSGGDPEEKYDGRPERSLVKYVIFHILKVVAGERNPLYRTAFAYEPQRPSITRPSAQVL